MIFQSNVYLQIRKYYTEFHALKDFFKRFMTQDLKSEKSTICRPVPKNDGLNLKVQQRTKLDLRTNRQTAGHG